MSQLQQNQQLHKIDENQMNQQKELSQNNINPQKNSNGDEHDKNFQPKSGQNDLQDQEKSDNQREGSEQQGEQNEHMRNQQDINNEQKQNVDERQNQREQEQQNRISNQQQYNQEQKDNKSKHQEQENQQQVEKEQKLHLNIKEQEVKRKLHNQSPFMWGQQKKQQNNERTYEHLFINSNYKSQELLIHTKQLSNKIREEKQQEHKKKAKQNKIIKPPVADDVDIWSDIKSSMLQKSRLSQQTKSINTQLKPKSQPKGYEKNKIQSERINKRKNSDRQKLSSPSIFKQQKKVILKIGRNPQKKQDTINNIQDMRKIIAEKVKRWRSEQKQIQARRINKFQNEKEKLKMEQQKQIEEQRLKKQIEKNQRVKAISQKLKKKKKRGQTSTSPQKQDKQTIKKVRKSNTQKNLKKNERVQKDQNKSKNNKNQENKISSPKFISKQLQQEDFSIHWNRKVDSFEQQKQKLMRRRYFEQRIREVPISVNENKKLKILIEVDKSSNPLKYQLLQKKGMSDAEIFHSSKQFKIPENPKKIGKQYLQQIRQKNKSVDLRRYMSQQSILNLPKYERNWKSPLIETILPKQQFSNITVSKILNKYSQKKKEILKEDDQYLISIKK